MISKVITKVVFNGCPRVMLTLVELPFSSFTVGGTLRLTVDSHFSMDFKRKRVKINSQFLIMFFDFSELTASQVQRTDLAKSSTLAPAAASEYKGLFGIR